MSAALTAAMKARRDARKMHGSPLVYAAWRRVSYFESLLTDDEFTAYQSWASDTIPQRSHP